MITTRGEAHRTEGLLHLCAACRKNWAVVDEGGTLVCSACWVRAEKRTAPVKEPYKAPR